MKIKKPSVSKILEMIFWEVFEELPPFILQKAINKGNCLHQRAEYYINNFEILECICEKPVKSHNTLFNNLINDLNKLDYNWVLKSEEKYETEWLVGIIDLVVIKENKILFIDFKTNSKIHIMKWKYQLVMYAYLYFGDWNLFNWDNVELQVWHYNINHKKTIYNIEKPTNKEIQEIQETIKVYWKEQKKC